MNAHLYISERFKIFPEKNKKNNQKLYRTPDYVQLLLKRPLALFIAVPQK